MKKNTIYGTKQSPWLRAIIGGIILLALVVPTSAPAVGTRATGATSATLSVPATAADPDLCALLPSEAGWSVSASNRTQSCRATNTGDTSGRYKDVKQAEITKYASSDAARAQLKTLYNTATANGFGRWDPTDQYGDQGFGYDIIPININDPGGAFTRGPYLVMATARRGTGMDDPGNVHALLKVIDDALRGAGQPEQNPEALLVTVAGTKSTCAYKTTQAGVFYVLRGPAKFKSTDQTGNLVRRDAPVFFQTDDGTERYIDTPAFAIRIPPAGKLTYASFGQIERNALPLFYGTEIKIPGLAKIYEDRWYIMVELGPNEFYQVGPDGYLKLGCSPTESVKIGRGVFQALVKDSPSPAAPLHKIETDTAVITPLSGGRSFNALGPIYQAGNIGARISINATDPAKTGVTIYVGSAQVAPKSGGAGVTITVGQHVDVTQNSVSPPTTVVDVPGIDNYTFPETGKAATGIFMDYWQTHGGLAQQGYPVSGLLREKSDLNGQTYTVQYYERAVFEFHTEYAPPNDVLLSQLGTFMYKRKYPNGAPNQKPNQTSGNSNFFKETGHWVGGKFWQYWQTHGGLAQQGYPISDEFPEVSQTDGKTYTVQYFERAVFELHPEFAPPNDVLLSLLGNFFYKQKYGGGGPGPGAPTATPGGGGNCSDTVNLAAASNGGKMVGWSTGNTQQNVIDGKTNTSWQSGAKGDPASPFPTQYLIVQPAGNKVYTINKVRINPGAAPGDPPNTAIKDFEIRVSTEPVEAPGLRTVYKGTIPSSQNAFYEFTFPPVQAKYVGLFMLTNFGNPTYMEVAEFEVYAADPNGSCSGGGGNPTPVATPTSVASGQCSGIPANQNMTVTPSNCAKAGTSFVFEAAGFNPGESVQAAVTAPDGQVYSASNQLVADQNGAIRSPNALTLTTTGGTLLGTYMITMEGVTSHRKATGYIRLLAP